MSVIVSKYLTALTLSDIDIEELSDNFNQSKLEPHQFEPIKNVEAINKECEPNKDGNSGNDNKEKKQCTHGKLFLV